MVNGMFEPCPIINYKMCGFCTHHKRHIYCGIAGAENKIEENLHLCPKVKTKRGQRKKRMTY